MLLIIAQRGELHNCMEYNHVYTCMTVKDSIRRRAMHYI